MADYPLIFRITHAVRSPGFEATVRVDGRALMTWEDGEWWCHGVDPGGLTENGDGPFVAYERFRLTFRQVLNDLAEEADSYEAFQRDARMFFSTDGVEEARWNRAVEALRQGAEVAEAFQELERVPPRPSVMTTVLLKNCSSAPLGDASKPGHETLVLAA
jgi:hypothetical protein